MKIKVITNFRDKFDTSRLYSVGDILDFDDERAANVIGRHLAQAVEVPETEEPTAPETECDEQTTPDAEEANLFTEPEVKPKRGRKTKSE